MEEEVMFKSLGISLLVAGYTHIHIYKVMTHQRGSGCGGVWRSGFGGVWLCSSKKKRVDF